MAHEAELHALLTHYRGSVPPESRGLLPRQRTRGPRVTGLSQGQADELLANPDATANPVLGLINVRGGWPAGMYARLERGQLEHPLPEFLDDVALLLGMDEHARGLLWRYAAGAAPLYPLRPTGSSRSPDQQAKLDNIGAIFGQIAWTTDHAFRRLQWNQLALEMFPPSAVVDGLPPENFIEWTLFHGRNGFNMHWEAAWQPLVLAMLRGRLQAYPGDRELMRVEGRVLADPTLAPCYLDPALDALVPDARPQPMRHGKLGPGWASLVFGQTPGTDCDFMIIDFQPDPSAETAVHGDFWTTSDADTP